MQRSVSRTQVDRLGERLKRGPYPESDLRLLDDYRRSFGEAYEEVIRVLHGLTLSPTGRPAKSTSSIVEKLKRESIRLSQMQDIAGCRIIVPNITEQESLVRSLEQAFARASLVDRREKPSHGYRAVHVVATVSGRPIEIQVRTALQHLWAELSEKSSDVIDPAVKYGGGPAEWRGFLQLCSEGVARYEKCEMAYAQMISARQKCALTWEELRQEINSIPVMPPPDEQLLELQEKLEEFTRDLQVADKNEQERRRELSELWDMVAHKLKNAISWLETKRQEE